MTTRGPCEWQDPRFPMKILPTLQTASAGLPVSHNGSCAAISCKYALDCPHDTEKNRPPSSIAPWSSSDAHVHIIGASGKGSAMTLTHL